MSELPPYPREPMPPGPEGQPHPEPYTGPWVAPQQPWDRRPGVRRGDRHLGVCRGGCRPAARLIR
ncbi:hypothetical protein Pflav_072450 [Phytohabitans flavus]|uniref:Uncharacterized protein n=1 Tax=Phytohabitans flavus TaxID=1076124 RepID=A0A6F8Y409_9ACTN|nr:hypothetical protein Pflav_072450 [Phytohabitans flavus]